MALHVERVSEILNFLLQLAGDFEAFEGGLFFGKIRTVLRFREDWGFGSRFRVQFAWFGMALPGLCDGLVLRFGRAALHVNTILLQAAQTGQAMIHG